MEKTDKKPAPGEVVLDRPPLFNVVWVGQESGVIKAIDGVWLSQNNSKVVVQAPKQRHNSEIDFVVGFTKSGHPAGPAYTGPIDDEMMANILIYGG